MAKGLLSVRAAKHANQQRRSTRFGNNDVLTELHRTVVGGKTVYIPKSMVAEGKELSQLLKEDTTMTLAEKTELARDYRRRAYEYDASWRAERLAHFVERMPDVVEGLLKADEAGFFNAEEHQILDDIINNLAEMDDETRAQFFEDNRDLFADLAGFYTLLKRYGYGIGNAVTEADIAEKDMDFIHKKGYSSWSSYREGMITNLRTIRRRTGQYLRD